MAIITEKLNVTLMYNLADKRYGDEIRSLVQQRSANRTLDFYIEFFPHFRGALYSYNYVDYCYQVVKPQDYSIIELVLFLPFDK